MKLTLVNFKKTHKTLIKCFDGVNLAERYRAEALEISRLAAENEAGREQQERIKLRSWLLRLVSQAYIAQNMYKFWVELDTEGMALDAGEQTTLWSLTNDLRFLRSEPLKAIASLIAEVAEEGLSAVVVPPDVREELEDISKRMKAAIQESEIRKISSLDELVALHYRVYRLKEQTRK